MAAKGCTITTAIDGQRWQAAGTFDVSPNISFKKSHESYGYQGNTFINVN